MPLVEGMAPLWPDEAAESAYRAEARGRGEPVAAPAPPPAADADEPDPGPLPPLEPLVARLPPAVRGALDDLFRARFLAVKRVPRQALKA